MKSKKPIDMWTADGKWVMLLLNSIDLSWLFGSFYIVSFYVHYAY